MLSMEIVELSRLQFALTAMYHFIFVPLTLGMAFLLAIMETVYVSTGKQIWKDMTKFWGKLFAVNFALGVATGLTMEFQFGTNWSTYSSYVGDIFGAPLAIEGLMAFFLESTMIGLFFFGWDRMSKRKHLMVTYLVAFGSNLSALWILVANGWMQFPGVEGLLHEIQNPNPEITKYVISAFNYDTGRMEMDLAGFWNLVLSPLAQVKFVHTVSAGYVTGSVFVAAISSYYLLKKRDVGFAQRSFSVASIFGLIMTVNLIYIGDMAGVEMRTAQPVKLASIEAEWHTQPAPASFNLIAFPSQEEEKNDFAIEIPYVLGLLTTHSLDTEVKGLTELKADNQIRIEKGVVALIAYEKLQEYEKQIKEKGSDDFKVSMLPQFRADYHYTARELDTLKADYKKQLASYQADYDANKLYLGYGLLAKLYLGYDNLTFATATPEQLNAAILKASDYTIPAVAPLFWSFRIMVGIGFLLLLIFAIGTWMTLKNRIGQTRWFHRIVLLALPLPWIACECGWFVNEYGRQPWAIEGVLPTGIAHSALSVGDLIFSIGLIVILYTLFLVVEMFLMFRYGRQGPSSLGTGRYHFETIDKSDKIEGVIK